MKKIMLSFCIVLLVLAGCGTSSSKTELNIFNLKPEIDEALRTYAKEYGDANGLTINVKSCGGGCDYSGQLKSEFQSGNEPDIFVIQGKTEFSDWEHKIEDLSDQEWAGDTEYAYVSENKTYGFPYSVEGYGIIYNKDMLEKANINPEKLTNFKAYQEAFAIIESKKDELGITNVLSMAAGPTMTWLTGSQNFNAYLSNGLPATDKSIVEEVLAGNVEEQRLSEYVDWVELLFNNADPTILNTGNYDAQVNAFRTGKTAFIAQGNWIVPNVKEATFDMGIAPMGTQTKDTNGIFLSAPSWYAVNKDSQKKDEAKKFLSAIYGTPEGNDFLVNKAQMVPAFKSITLVATHSLNQDVTNWIQKGNNYAWNQTSMPNGFNNNILGSVYSQYANKQITKEEFLNQMKVTIKEKK